MKGLCRSQTPIPSPFGKAAKNINFVFKSVRIAAMCAGRPQSFAPPAIHGRQIGLWPVVKVRSFAVYHHAYHPAFKNDLPYVVAIVELEEGPHLLTNIIGCDHEALRCEMPVQVIWEDIAEGFSLPKFQPIS
jgi:hypothetical protein